MKQPAKVVQVRKDNFDAFESLLQKHITPEDDWPEFNTAKRQLRKDYFSKQPPFEAYLAKVDGIFVGNLILVSLYSSRLGRPSLYIEDLFIAEETRGRGIGQMLFSHTVKLAKDRGCGRVDWLTYTSNIRAHKFYLKNGAKHRPDRQLFRLDKEQIDNFHQQYL